VIAMRYLTIEQREALGVQIARRAGLHFDLTRTTPMLAGH
jgi:hypothetical protein